MNKIRKVYDMLLWFVQILCNGREVPSPSPSLIPSPSWRSNKLSRSAQPATFFPRKTPIFPTTPLFIYLIVSDCKTASPLQNSLHVSLLKVREYMQIHFAYNDADAFRDTILSHANRNLQPHNLFPACSSIILLNSIFRNYLFLMKKICRIQSIICK